MLFVSRYAANLVSIQSEVADIVVIDGKHRPVIAKPEIMVQFTQGCIMTPNERYAAVRKLRERWGDAAFGALPETHSGIMTDGTGRAFQAVDPNFRVSGFRTDDPQQCPPDQRAFYEERLLTRDCGFGTDYIMVESGGVDKPWPSYDKTHHNSVAKMVAELGLNVETVLEYELATKNRQSVVDSLNALVAASNERALDDRDFSVSVP